MKKLDLYKLRGTLEHVLFLINQEESNPSFNWGDAPVICEINGYRWLLGQGAYEEMNWEEAKAWCKSVGGELPPREVLLLAYLNEANRPLFKPEWYCSSTEYNAANVWKQNFGTGTQSANFKTDNYYVRAVKKVKI